MSCLLRIAQSLFFSIGVFVCSVISLHADVIRVTEYAYISNHDVEQARKLAFETALIRAAENAGVKVYGYSTVDTQGSIDEFTWLQTQGVIKNYQVVDEIITKDQVSITLEVSVEPRDYENEWCPGNALKRTVKISLVSSRFRTGFDKDLVVAVEKLYQELPRVIAEKLTNDNTTALVVDESVGKRDIRENWYYANLFGSYATTGSHNRNSVLPDITIELSINADVRNEMILIDSNKILSLDIKANITDPLSGRTDTISVRKKNIYLRVFRGMLKLDTIKRLFSRLDEPVVGKLVDSIQEFMCASIDVRIANIENDGQLMIPIGSSAGIRLGQLFSLEQKENGVNDVATSYYIARYIDKEKSFLNPVNKPAKGARIGQLITLQGQ
jgi:hypothetical protein